MWTNGPKQFKGHKRRRKHTYWAALDPEERSLQHVLEAERKHQRRLKKAMKKATEEQTEEEEAKEIDELLDAALLKPPVLP